MAYFSEFVEKANKKNDYLILEVSFFVSGCKELLILHPMLMIKAEASRNVCL